jgi:cation-transporting P-type ATPase E
VAQRGLSADEVAARVREGRVNVAEERTSRTLGEIVRANVFTRFNAILGTMFVLILIFGAGQDALFGFVLLFNTLIGVIQEWRAKRTLDRLAVLSAPRSHVVRDGALVDIAVGDVVADDVIELRAGDQVPADGEILVASGLEVDESLLTGESDPVEHDVGDEVRSGSIVVAGTARMRATAVGPDSYAHRLATEARRFSLVRSELMDGINTILRYVQWALLPTALLLALSQFRVEDTTRHAIAGVVAGVVAMIPEGLVLLTSLAFAIGAMTLARQSVLVQELPAVEGLARVDVVLLDKTGTITEGAITFDGVHALCDDDHVNDALGALADDEHGNATLLALGEAFPPPDGWVRTASTPFSSARKWSSATFDEHGTWVLGAPELVMPDRDGDDPVRAQANELAALGQRVLLLARSEAETLNEKLPPDMQAAALVAFEERIRDDAAETLAYFARQGVRTIVISGDNPRTVGAVAGRVGIDHADNPVDAREVADDAWPKVLDDASVFGRVTPQQKRAIVHALQSKGHVVAMTGDGVNDALALKDADIGVAMGNGAPATRAVAQIVLLDGRFATMPRVVAEGRRVIANVERVANLFVTKTFYAMLLAVAIGVARWPYPFLPRHLTIVSSLTIGIPAFFLALAPNNRRYVRGFVPRVARFAAPAGAVAAAATFVSFAIARNEPHVTVDHTRTAATLTLMAVGLWVLNVLARPITPLRAALFGAMVGAFALTLGVPRLRHFFALQMPRASTTVGAAICALVAIAVIEVAWQVTQLRAPPEDRTQRFALRNPASASLAKPHAAVSEGEAVASSPESRA